MMIIESAGGIQSPSNAKSESDVRKIYKNAAKALGDENSQNVFTVIYFSKVSY